MHIRRLFLPWLCLIGVLATSALARAGGTVELNLVGDAQGSALGFQEWAQALGKAGIRNVRIRSGTEDDKPGIVTEGTADKPVYVVTGIITSRNEILLPGARFKRGDVTRLAAWLKDLAEKGPAAGRKPTSPYGLSGDDFAKIRRDLATPVGFATLGMTRQQVVEKIAGQLKLPLKLDADVARALGNDKLEDELTDLSCGTALACVLRPVGYCMTPQVSDGQMAYVVGKSDGKPADSNVANASLATLKAWPIGWTSSKSNQDAVPALYEFRNINVKDVSAATALDAIGKRLNTPVLYDRRALAQQKIDPGKTMVSLPNSKTFYASALRRMLFQARLKFEVRFRFDDAGAPFLWVTTIKQAE
jgi:hypothetical protein